RGAISYRAAAAAAVLAPYLISRLMQPLGLAATVTLAFAVAASTFAPLLVLGVWWPRLTVVGALAGLSVGTGCALVAIGATFMQVGTSGWTGVLLGQPAAWSAPLAFVTMVAVSRMTPGTTPPHTNRTLSRLHTPESLLPR
ncbi:sodium:solute symporter family transporter, partial [Nostocoides sp.]|uniref:sodium:solute symporter family transporter n=2 Tax=Nostocoides sp. TaxID=1917966 RepID=UPI003BB0C681